LGDIHGSWFSATLRRPPPRPRQRSTAAAKIRAAAGAAAAAAAANPAASPADSARAAAAAVEEAEEAGGAKGFASQASDAPAPTRCLFHRHHLYVHLETVRQQPQRCFVSEGMQAQHRRRQICCAGAELHQRSTLMLILYRRWAGHAFHCRMKKRFALNFCERGCCVQRVPSTLLGLMQS